MVNLRFGLLAGGAQRQHSGFQAAALNGETIGVYLGSPINAAGSAKKPVPTEYESTAVRRSLPVDKGNTQD